MQKGNLVYIPAEVTLLQFNEEIGKNMHPERTYIGPSPIKFHQLKRPMNLLLVDNIPDEKYIKVWFNGDKWFVNKTDAQLIEEKND